MSLIKCPECGKEISDKSQNCIGCGMPISQMGISAEKSQTIINNNIVIKEDKSGTAALLSFIIPGAGQMYLGSIVTGLLWLFCTAIGYMMFVVPGMILHIICIFSAYNKGKELIA